MISAFIVFDEEWVREKLQEGVDVCRTVEKWLESRQNLKIASRTSTVFIVVLEDDNLNGLKKAVLKMVSQKFGVSRPSKICRCVENKQEDKEKLIQKAKNNLRKMVDSIECEPVFSDAEDGCPEPQVGSAGRLLQSKKLLSELLDKVPFKYSEELSNYLRETVEIVPMMQQLDCLESYWGQSLLVAMDDGYGMTEFLSSLCKLYTSLGIAKNQGGNAPEVRESNVEMPDDHSGIHATSPAGIAWESAANEARSIQNCNDDNPGSHPILCLNISDWQTKLHDIALKDYLRKMKAFSNNFKLVFRIPFMEEQAMNIVAEELGDIFSIQPIVVPPASLENLVDYAKEQLKKRKFIVSADTEDIIERMIIHEKRDASFFGFKTVDKIVDKIIYEKAKGNCHAQKTDRHILRSDIVSCAFDGDRDFDPEEELKGLVGMESVKEQIKQIVAQIKAYKQLSGRKKSIKRPAIHMMFTGNPGTGKTTVARIIAKLFCQEGILRKGNLIEIKGRDLIGEWIGTTAPRTSTFCRDAYGSVLFIDEAYSLSNGDKSSRDYGPEAIATLVAEMENHRDDMCVIMAGYADEMKIMMSVNPGMESRIPYHVAFPNYSREELAKIFFLMAESNGFKYEKALESAVSDYFNKISNEAISTKGFANGRFVRNLFERTWGKSACRSRLDREEIEILVSDFASTIESGEFKQIVENKFRSKIGFGS
ncbi:AAA family ATPase [bacterium]|nr:AAA family ATPase [bacterium]